MHVRRTRTRKALVSDKALSVSEVQAMGGYEEVKAEIITYLASEPVRQASRSRFCIFNIQ
jgi:hypothetical protein